VLYLFYIITIFLHLNTNLGAFRRFFNKIRPHGKKYKQAKKDKINLKYATAILYKMKPATRVEREESLIFQNQTEIKD
jgi:hypothetical protein